MNYIKQTSLTNLSLLGSSKYKNLITPYNLNEDYVVEVLGFERKVLAEGRYNLLLQEQILQEHLLFEAFWDKAKEILGKGYDKIKEKAMEPVEALKEFGNDVKGIVAALTAAVQDGKMLKQVKNFVVRDAKTVGRNIAMSIQEIGKLLEKYNMPTFAKGLYKLAGKLEKIRRGIAAIDGWKGLLSSLAYILGIRYLDDEFGISKKLQTGLDILRDPKEFFKGEVLDFLTGKLEDAAEEKIEEIKAQALKIITEKFGFVEEIITKIKEYATKLAGKAIEQFAGPIAWVKQAIELFGTASFVAGAIGPALSAGQAGIKISQNENKQLRQTIRKLLIEEKMREEQSFSDTFDSIKKFMFEEDIAEYISEVWEEKSDTIVEKIAKSGINRDAEEFAAGATEGDDDFENDREYKPDTPLRYEVFFQEDPDYVMGYKWGYQNGATWDGNNVPTGVMDQFILEQVEEYKLKAKTEITKDVLYTLYDSISPNRILRKVWYAIKDAYAAGGIKQAITKGVPIALTVAVVETLDQAVLPILCLKFGIPPLTTVVGLGEMVYPVVMPMFGSQEETDFVGGYQTRAGDEELID